MACPPDRVFSLVIMFGHSSIYSPLSNIHIPYLCRPQKCDNDDSTSPESFPFIYKIVLSFQPLVPIPTSFKVSITFNDREAKVWRGKMDSISLEFQDLFLPIFVPTNIQMSTPQFLNTIFDQLWEKVLGETTQDSEKNKR